MLYWKKTTEDFIVPPNEMNDAGKTLRKIFCEVETCMYNENFECTLHTVEIDETGKCYQCMTVVIPEETLAYVPEEALDLIKKEHRKNENELWEKRRKRE